MKKIFYLSLVAFVASSCAVGTYNPMARNNFGAQTTVVLDKANFRVVRDVEAVVEVNNTNLKRQDVEKSAYGQLLQNARLTGSQVLINVVIEEICRDRYSTLTNRKQYVAARATVIEFLKEDGQPVSSPSTNRLSETTGRPQSSKNVENQHNQMDKDMTTEQPIAHSEEVATDNTNQHSDWISDDELDWLIKKVKVIKSHYGYTSSQHFKTFKKLEKLVIQTPTRENVDKLIAASVYLAGVIAEKNDPTNLEKEIKTVQTDAEKIDILLKYCK